MSKQNKMKSVGNAVDPEIQNRANQLEIELNKQLREASEEFNNTSWNKLTIGGNPVPPLPISIIEDFKKAYLNKYAAVMFHVAKQITAQTPETIVYNQINSLLQVIVGADPISIAVDYDSFVEKRERYDMIIKISEAVFDEHKSAMEMLAKTIKESYDPATFLPIKNSSFHN
jgi:hypothetical protein